MAPAKTGEPVLLQIPFSHYCKRARWALDHAGIPYQVRNIWPWQIRPVYDVHPAGTVPVLHMGDRLLVDSGEIMTWVAAQAPGLDLYPPSAAQDIQAWESWASQELGALARRQAYRIAYHDPKGFTPRRVRRVLLRAARPFILRVLKFYKVRRFDDADQEAAPEALRRIASQLQASGGPFLFGQKICAADITVATLIEPLLWVTGPSGLGDHPDLPAVEAWARLVAPASSACVRARKMRRWHWKHWTGLDIASG